MGNVNNVNNVKSSTEADIAKPQIEIQIDPHQKDDICDKQHDNVKFTLPSLPNLFVISDTITFELPILPNFNNFQININNKPDDWILV